MLQMILNQMKLSLLPSVTLPISFLQQFETIFCEIPVLLYSTPAYQQLTPIFFLLLSVFSLPYVSFPRHSVLPVLYASYPHHLPCHTCPLMQQIFFSLWSHHTLPVHAEHNLLQNSLAPARVSFFLAHMDKVIPYPLLSFSLCKHNHPLYKPMSFMN